MTNLKFKGLFPIVFLILVIVTTFIISNKYAKDEFKQQINFVVNRVHITPALRCYLYDKNENELDLGSYTFFENSNIKVGDSLAKPSNSSTLFCYRKNSSGKYEIIKEFQPK